MSCRNQYLAPVMRLLDELLRSIVRITMGLSPSATSHLSLLRTVSGRRLNQAYVADIASYVTAVTSAVNITTEISDALPKYALSSRDYASPRYVNVTSCTNTETMPASVCVRPLGTSRYANPRATSIRVVPRLQRV